MGRRAISLLGPLVYFVFYTSRPLADHTSLGIGVGVSSAVNTEIGATLPKGRLAVGGRAQYLSFDTVSDQQLLEQGGSYAWLGIAAQCPSQHVLWRHG